jgi:hypothetical protein
MKYRKLRIAWSAAFGLLALLLIVLCVRSYDRLDILEKRTRSLAVQICSVKGRIAIARLDPRTSYVIRRPYLSFAAGDAADWRKAGVLGFAYYDDGAVTALIAPHWLPALLSVAIAVIPWTSRTWRFSLRTLLIGMTVVALAVGLLVASTR